MPHYAPLAREEGMEPPHRAPARRKRFVVFAFTCIVLLNISIWGAYDWASNMSACTPNVEPAVPVEPSAAPTASEPADEVRHLHVLVEHLSEQVQDAREEANGARKREEDAEVAMERVEGELVKETEEAERLAARVHSLEETLAKAEGLRDSAREAAEQRAASQQRARTQRKPYPTVRQLDVVYTWVNGSEPEWRAKRRATMAADVDNPAMDVDVEDNQDNRFRDQDTLRMSLRSLEKFGALDFVRKVWIVTADSQRPVWLADHPKVEVVHHSAMWNNVEEGLPSFNSQSIESNLHRIPGLAEDYWYFNDDMMLTRTVHREDLVRNCLAEVTVYEAEVCGPALWLSMWVLSDTEEGRNEHWAGSMLHTLDKLEEVTGESGWRARPNQHTPILFNKGIMREVEAALQDEFDHSSSHHFRTDHDLSIGFLYNQWIARYYRAWIPTDTNRECGYVKQGLSTPEEIAKQIARTRDTHPLFTVVQDEDGPYFDDVQTHELVFDFFFTELFPERCAFEVSEEEERRRRGWVIGDAHHKGDAVADDTAGGETTAMADDTAGGETTAMADDTAGGETTEDTETTGTAT